LTEEQKYQGPLFKSKSKKLPTANPPAVEPKAMPPKAYVEDAPEEEYDSYEDYEGHSDDDDRSPAEPLPEAPTPPPAAEEVNVFDFLVASNTPNASSLNLHRASPQAEETNQLVRYDYGSNVYVNPGGFMTEEEHLVQYGTGPIPAKAYETPAVKTSRKKVKDGEVKTDKKRKRLHVDVNDQVMTDAPPVLHSGLTGGLSRMMKPIFPPSPDYSGGDAGEPSPGSPLKKTKHSRHSKSGREGIGNNLLAMMTTGTKTKTKKRKVSSKKHHSHRHHRIESEKAPKLIEYRPQSRDEKPEPGDNQVILYKPRADLLLSFINKGPESERGCSMNKVLKRFHRERTSSGSSLGKLMEEKELWKSLRMRKNERGEIVLFCL
jgi:cell growth-regulating nucleolar protein